MNGLIACECSGRVREAFRRRGHNFWSADLKPAEDASEYHFQGDALMLSYCVDWDFLGAHPTCTFLCNSGVHLLTSDRPQEANRWQEMEEGAELFKAFYNAPVKKKYLENPVMHGHALKIIGADYTQLIQPYFFGESESKATCLWLVGLPPLQRTTSQEDDLFIPKLKKPAVGHWDNQTASGQNKLGPSAQRATLRSRTYKGIAEAMAEQWSNL